MEVGLSGPTYLEVEVTSRRAAPLGVRGPENTNLLTSFPVAVSLFYIWNNNEVMPINSTHSTVMLY